MTVSQIMDSVTLTPVDVEDAEDGVEGYVARTYTKSCFVFQLKREDRSDNIGGG